MRLNRKLIARHFPGAKITWQLGSGYLIRTQNGGSILLTNKEFRDWKGGEDVYGPALRLWRELHGEGTILVSGPLHHILKATIAGQAAGVHVEPQGQERFFGLYRDPPPTIPQPSGAHGRAAVATDSAMRAAGLTGGKWGDGLRFGEDSAANVARYRGSNSVFVTGPSGSGKLARFLASMITEAQNTAFILLDWKSEHLAISHRRRQSLGPTRVIAPYREGLPDACAHFADETDSYNPVPVLLNPASESYVANNQALAGILIAPDSSGESKETGFFVGNSQAIVSGTLMQLVENYPDEATLPEMASILCTDRIFEFCQTAMKTGSRYVRDRLSIFGTPDAVELKGGLGDIRRTLTQQLSWLSDPAMARVLGTPKEPWRFDDLKRGARPSSVYICVPPKFADISRRFFRLLLGCAFMELQATPQGDWPVTCVADEFPLLGRAEIFNTIFAEGRGHGIRVVAVCQTAGQMIAAYGEQGFRNFLSCSGLQLFFPPKDYQTAVEISKLAGRKTILTLNHSQSGRVVGDGWSGVSVGETGMDVLTPHEAIGLERDRIIAFAPGLVPNVMILRAPNYWEYPDIQRLTDPNPYAPGYRPPPSFLSRQTPGRRGEDLQSKIERWKNDRGRRS